MRRWLIGGLCSVFCVLGTTSCKDAKSSAAMVTLRVQGVMPADLVWAKDQMDFGEVEAFQCKELRNTIRNTGQTAATGVISLDGTPWDVFQITQGAGAVTILPGDSLVVAVLAAPNSGTLVTAQMRIVY